jgi:hypothetical protein
VEKENVPVDKTPSGKRREEPPLFSTTGVEAENLAISRVFPFFHKKPPYVYCF